MDASGKRCCCRKWDTAMISIIEFLIRLSVWVSLPVYVGTGLILWAVADGTKCFWYKDSGNFARLVMLLVWPVSALLLFLVYITVALYRFFCFFNGFEKAEFDAQIKYNFVNKRLDDIDNHLKYYTKLMKEYVEKEEKKK